MTNPNDIVVDELRQSLAGLVEHYTGVCPSISDEPITGVEPTHAAAVGFGDEDMRGSVTLLTDATDAQQLSASDNSEINDWVGELANQLVGRLKNRIAEYGHLLNMGLPVAMQGDDLTVTGNDVRFLHMKWSGVYLLVAFKLVITDGLVLERDPEASAAEEGSLCLF